MVSIIIITRKEIAMFKYTVSLSAVIVLFVSACAEVDYVGDSYPPTTHIDVFYSEHDVEKDYRVMGHAVAHAGEFVSTQKLQDALVDEARDRGADGIIITGLDSIPKDDSADHDERQVSAIFIKYK